MKGNKPMKTTKTIIYPALALFAFACTAVCGQVDEPSSVYQPFTFTTLAGLAGVAGSTDGVGSNARFNYPASVTVDRHGIAYVADTYNHTIRKINRSGFVSTFAGSAGIAGSDDGTGSAARFNQPYGVAVDISGNLFVADCYNHTIRKITPAAVVTTLAGLAGVPGSADGTGSDARFNYPVGVAVDSTGYVYVADDFNDTIRKISPTGDVTTIAGWPGLPGSTDGTGSDARFNQPTGVAVDSGGNIYIADTGNSTIRKITQAAVVTTFAGQAGALGSRDGPGAIARFGRAQGLGIDQAGILYVADTQNYTIRKITPAAIVSTLAGVPRSPGSADGTGSDARFNYPYNAGSGPGGQVYVADRDNHTIRVGVRASLREDAR
jgi:sugar lactone lactonase YvrE